MLGAHRGEFASRIHVHVIRLTAQGHGARAQACVCDIRCFSGFMLGAHARELASESCACDPRLCGAGGPAGRVRSAAGVRVQPQTLAWVYLVLGAHAREIASRIKTRACDPSSRRGACLSVRARPQTLVWVYARRPRYSELALEFTCM